MVDVLMEMPAAINKGINLPFQPYIKYPDGHLWSFCRGVDKTGGRVSHRFDSISSYFVDIVTSPFDQDVSALFVGNKGTGKSSTVISIDYNCAIKIAEWMNDGSRWDDYWNLHELTACILEEEATRLMNIQRKYIIKNFDDIGIGWGARNWRDDDNIQKNDIFQINRTDNAIQTFSIPNQFLLDKVPRSLVSHYVEMDEKIFEKGFTTIKLFKPKTMFREARIINPFLLVDRNKYVNYLIPAPPHDIWTEYKKLRQKNKDIAIRRRADQRVKADERKQLEEQVKMTKLLKAQAREGHLHQTKEEKREQIERGYEERFRQIAKDIVALHQESGKSLDKCMTTVCGKNGLRDAPLAYFRKAGLIEKYRLDERVT
jgi:hypothetical protein